MQRILSSASKQLLGAIFSAAGRGLTVSLMVLVVCSCASKVRTNVNAFKNAELTRAEGSIFVDSLRPENSPSLEFAHYRSILESKLKELGYAIGNESSADYVALLDYTVGEATTSDGKSSRTVFVDSSAVYPRYTTGAGVWVVNDDEDLYYRRTVSLVIAQNNADRDRLYEVNGTSIGRCSVLSKVFKPMLEGMLQSFPAGDGSLQRVTVEGSDRC